MGTSRGVAAYRWYIFLLLILWNSASVRQFAEGSFANLVKRASLSRDVSNSSNTENIYKTGPPCVTLSSHSRPYVDLYLSGYHSVQTVLIYLPENGTHLKDITLSILDLDQKQPIKKYNKSDGNVAIWKAPSSLDRTNILRLTGQRGSSFTVCHIEVYDVKLDDYCECDDECHRNKDVICNGVCKNVTHHCTKENVALNKQATMSSSYKESNASYAVNGITGTTFSAPGYTRDSSQWNCIHTDPDDTSPYWQVDLGREYTVNSVIIYRRGGDSGRARMAGVSVTVGETLCKNISFEDARDEKMPVICNPAPRGTFLNITRSGTYSIYGPTINLCEVQVLVCKGGYYGTDCNASCSMGCEEGKCDQTNGHCSCLDKWKGDKCDSCKPGWYGSSCSDACSEGCEGTCSVTNGACSCRAGWHTEPRCKAKCVKGRYGKGCLETCGHGCEDGRCNHVDGHCLCEPGWNALNGLCNTECSHGFYGKNCSEECGHCGPQNKPCDRETGHCPNKICLEGFIPPLCTARVDQGGTSHSVAGAGVGIFVFLLIVALIITAALLIRRKKHGREWPASLEPPPALAEGEMERLYANSSSPSVFFQHNVKENKTGACNLSTASTSKAVDAFDLEDDEDLLDSSQEDSEVVGDERWAVYQSIKVALDPLQQQLLDRLADIDKIKEEFKRLPAGHTRPYTVGALAANEPKNRFKKLYPYDHTRVALTPLADDPASDYINASFVRNLRDEQAYIATQGPQQHTVADLWRMVWQQNVTQWRMVWQQDVTQIVMLTNMKEGDKVKCHQYWPEKGERMTHHDVTIDGADVQLRADFYVRSFLLRKAKTSRPRQVTQYHMVVWPDHGVPSALALVNLQRYVSARTDPDSGPLLVHCSAGVGRTGTYIALDMLMQELKAQKQVDVLKTVTRMREDRVIMIQNVDQYVFLHEVLLEAYTSRDARVSVEDVDRVFPSPVNTKTDNSRIDREFKSLCQMKNFLSKPKYAMAEQDENKTKNRDASVMADDANLVFLSVPVSGRNQYINAVSVPSFRQLKGMLLTQLPLADTAVDLWRLVESFDVATIVSLGSKEEEKKKDYCHYWPRTEKNTTKAGPYVIKMTSLEALGDTLTSYDLCIERPGKASRNVRLLHLKSWGGEIPGNACDLLHLLSILDTVQSRDAATPIVIQCRDGARRSGLVCALSNIVSRLTYDRELDVYLTVRHVHNARPQAVTSKAQYRYCYQVALEYKKSFDIYANS